MRTENPLRLDSTFIEFAGSKVPDVAPTGQARIYYDQATASIKISTNGGSFSAPGAGSLALSDLSSYTIPVAPTAATTAALLKLGAGTFSGGSASGQYIGIAHNAATFAGNWLQFRDTTTTRFRVTGDGYIGIGSDPGTTSALRSVITGSTLTAALFMENVSTLSGATIRGARLAVYLAPLTGTTVPVAIGSGGTVFFRGAGTSVVTFMTGLDGGHASDDPGSAVGGTVTESTAIRANGFSAGAPSGSSYTVTAASGLMVNNQGSAHGTNGLTLATSYGIRVKAQSGAGTQSFGIVSEGGECQITTGAVGTKGLTISGVASQTAAILDLRSSAASVVQVHAAGTVTLAEAVNVVLGTTTGTKFGTVGGSSGQKLAFFNATPIVQPLLATGAGATADTIIGVLQNLGLVRQT